jgi:hypothetical protein
VATLGNSYSVLNEHVGAPVTVRVHRERIVIWRDAELLAEHVRLRVRLPPKRRLFVFARLTQTMSSGNELT